jgi:putative membrane protein
MLRVGRLLALVGGALLLALLGTGSFALATDSHHSSSGHKSHSGSQSRQHGADNGKGGNTQPSGQHQGGGNQNCGDNGYSSWDEEWLMMSIQGDRFEIAGGNLAQKKATTQTVRDLGARLVKDHTKSLKDATDVADELGIDVPDQPSPSQQWQLRAVAQFSGSEFDKWYSDLEVQDHLQDIQEAQDEVDKGCNDKIKQLAEDDLPVLQQHLELARAALAASGDKNNNND